MVSRENGYDYKRALREISSLADQGYCDGIELMMLIAYYDKKEDVIRSIKDSGLKTGTIHCEKEIGTMISQAGTDEAEGRAEESGKVYSEALELFKYNCSFGEELGTDRMVLHLWGGYPSDRHIEFNVRVFPELRKIASDYGLRILVENIPSQKYDPRTNWHKLLGNMGDSGFVFDTRFGMLHKQIEGILTDSELVSKIEHVHISDFAGYFREFFALRPILHPGEGFVDFEKTAQLLEKIGYESTITLESPVVCGQDLDIEKIKRTLAYVRSRFLK